MIQNANKNVNRSEEWLDLALKSKDPEKKLEYCSKHLEFNPNDEDVWLYKLYFLENLEKKKEQIDCAYKIIQKRDIFLEKPLATLFRLGASSLDSDGETAVRYFDKILKEKPDYVWAYIYKGDALLNLKRYAEAIVCYDNVLKASTSKPCKSLVYGRKAGALEFLGKMEEAIVCCDSGLDIDPGHFVMLGLKGECLFMIGKYEEAIACFNEVLRINPNDKMAKESKEMVEKQCTKAMEQ